MGSRDRRNVDYFEIVDLTVGIRASQDDEVTGLDISLHGEEGYNLEA